METLINKSYYYFLSFPFICHWKIVLQERFEADTHVSFTSQKDEKERITKAGGWEISRREREKERIYVWENPWKVTMGERRRWMSRLPEYKHNVCILPIHLKFNLKNTKNSKEKWMSTWLTWVHRRNIQKFLVVGGQPTICCCWEEAKFMVKIDNQHLSSEGKKAWDHFFQRERERQRERKKWYLNAGRWPTSLHSSPVLIFYFKKLSRTVIFFQ